MPTTPVTVNPTGAPILPGQNLDNPQTPATVPVTAPPATATTPTPVTTPPSPSKSTAVVSSDQGQAYYDQATNTIKTGSNDIAAAAAAKQANAGKPGYDVFGNVANTPAYSQTPTPNGPQKVTPPTLEEQVVNEGKQTIYNTTTGEQQKVDIGAAIPVGYTTVNPATGPATPVVSSASLPSGTTIKQFSDGTYGSYNLTGGYIGASTADQFQTAQNAQSIQNSWNKVLNGSYPLTASQQAQITSIQSIYADLIEQQETANANLTGGVTVAQNLYGMGNSTIGLGAIKASVDEGISKIADLQNKLVDSVNTMIAADNKDNYALVKEAYDSYTDHAKTLQDTFDKMKTSAQKEADKMKAGVLSDNEAAIKKYPDAGILETDTAAQRAAKLQNSPTYQQDQKTKAGQVDQDVLDGMLKIYNKTGAVPPGIGNASIALKKAFYAAIGGAPGLADEATTNAAALKASTKALTTQETQYTATQTSVSTIKSSMARLDKFIQPLADSGSPALNGPLRSAQKNLGSKTYSAFENEINTVATEYAKIITGASASIAGVSVQSVEDIKTALNDKVTIGQLETVLDSMKQDINARLVSQKGTIDQITSDIHDMGLTSTSKTTDTNSGGSDPAGLGI